MSGHLKEKKSIQITKIKILKNSQLPYPSLGWHLTSKTSLLV
jgi:hypothetical protein